MSGIEWAAVGFIVVLVLVVIIGVAQQRNDRRIRELALVEAVKLIDSNPLITREGVTVWDVDAAMTRSTEAADHFEAWLRRPRVKP